MDVLTLNQKAIANGLLNDSNAPVIRSPFSELVAGLWMIFTRESLMALTARYIRNPIPRSARVNRTIQFWIKVAAPKSANIAQTESPISEPTWTRSAGQNPRSNPRRTVSAVTTPGGAQNAMAKANDERNRDIRFYDKGRGQPRPFNSSP
jgi:hypothetical protein